MKKNTTISKCAGAVNAPRLRATRTCETTKIPAGMQKPDLWGFRYTTERKNQKMAKTIKGNDIFSCDMQINKTDKNPRFPKGLELSRPMLQAGALIFVCR